MSGTERTWGERQIAEAREKAAVLVEALPWIERFAGATVVVKFGGNAMVEPALTEAFADDMVFLRSVGLRPVVVHGGGPQIGAMLERLGHTSEFRGGFRVTTPEVVDVVGMILVGQVGPGIVAAINRHGPHALALSGLDRALLTARRTTATVDGESVDVGLVGEIERVNVAALNELLDARCIPVIASLAPDAQGQLLNVNADLAASAVAVALGAHKVVLLTDVPGLYADWPASTKVREQVTDAELAWLLPRLRGGMVPKMSACLEAVRGGVASAHVIDGRVAHAVLLEIFTDAGIGTMVVPR